CEQAGQRRRPPSYTPRQVKGGTASQDYAYAGAAGGNFLIFSACKYAVYYVYFYLKHIGELVEYGYDVIFRAPGGGICI
ncbi:MAG: hypothetical protein LIO38_07055, partial [Cloacibacillus sp.]|nr:hypothetical protein [Cloacibacillus sp.]